jgi:hypothetical protein
MMFPMPTQLRLRFIVALSLLLGFCFTSSAMERWAALSQLESGDNDHVVGTAGEVSRFQIKREVWKRYAHDKANWRNPADSLAVARGVMSDRCADFERRFHRPPTDFEFYVLWNAPAQIHRPSREVRNRAGRFCQLIRKETPA